MRLKELRKKVGKTQKGIAQMINTAESTYRGYENGTSEPSVATMLELADIFDVSLDFLCGRTWQNKVGHIPDDRSDIVKSIVSLDDKKFELVKSYVLFVESKK